MALNAVTLYCSQADLERLMSTYTVTAMVDDDFSSTINGTETDDITDVLTLAAETINMYCIWKYTPEMMATSPWVNRAATILAAYELRQRRNNECPEGLVIRAEKIEDQLEQILAGKLPIPGLPRRMRKMVGYSNIRFDPNYQFAPIRVEKRQSSKWSQTNETQNTDYNDLFTVDRP